MLILSRRQNEKVVFPNLGITIDVCRIRGNSVQLGVDAPSEVRVLRHELAESLGELTSGKAGSSEPKMSNHRLRNRLNQAGLALHLLQRQLEVGQHQEADKTLEKVIAEFQSLDDDLGTDKSRCKSPRRALLVEDDANESELLAGILRMSGYLVDTARDGFDAMEYLAENGHPDFVLLDMQMPRCDGPTTISAIRSNPAFDNLRLFAVSGKQAADVGVTIGPDGVNRWFRKPINPQALVNQMNRELELATEHTQLQSS